MNDDTSNSNLNSNSTSTSNPATTTTRVDCEESSTTEEQDLKAQQMNSENSSLFEEEAVVAHAINKRQTNETYTHVARQLGLPTLARSESRVVASPAAGGLQTHPFTHKLYLVASNPHYTCLSWSHSGQELQLNYIGLQDYLASEASIFSSRSVGQFTRQLKNYGFQRVQPDKQRQRTGDVSLFPLIWLHYKHPCLESGGRNDLLLLPPQHHATPAPAPEEQPGAATGPRSLGSASPNHHERMSARGDLCSAVNAYSAPLQLARSRLQTLLRYHADVRLLRDRANSAELLALLVPRRGRSANKATEPLALSSQAAKYVKPQESVMAFEAGFCPDYAGYYGNVPTAKINEFFAEYLPRYGAKTTGYKDIVTDASNRVNSFQQNLPIGMNYSEDEDELDDVALKGESAARGRQAGKGKCGKRSKPSAPVDDMELEQAMRALCGEDTEATQKQQKQIKEKSKETVNDGDSTCSDEAASSDSSSSSDSEPDGQADILKAAEKVAAAAQNGDSEGSSETEQGSKGSTDEERDEEDGDSSYKAAPPKRRRYNLRTPKRS